jgi:heme A synthase
MSFGVADICLHGQQVSNTGWIREQQQRDVLVTKRLVISVLSVAVSAVSGVIPVVSGLIFLFLIIHFLLAVILLNAVTFDSLFIPPDIQGGEPI